MTQPGDGYKVATDLLRREATAWDDQASAAQNIVVMTADFELGRVEAGIFQILIGAYRDVCGVVNTRCTDAVTNLSAAADTLRAVADTYDAEEESGLHRLNNIY